MPMTRSQTIAIFVHSAAVCSGSAPSGRTMASW